MYKTEGRFQTHPEKCGNASTADPDRIADKWKFKKASSRKNVKPVRSIDALLRRLRSPLPPSSGGWSGYLGSYEDGLAAGVSFRDLLPYETHGSAVVSQFHGTRTLLSRSLRSFFFFSFLSRGMRSFIRYKVSSKIVYKGQNKKGSIDRYIKNIYSERKECFSKLKIQKCRLEIGQKEWKQAR